jgi:2-methylaconitate cis-trans-isomerase PrpF
MLSRSIGLSRLPCTLMRGGTSRGVFFNRTDMPTDEGARDRVLLRALGSPHPLQVDGVGGGQTLTSKVAIIGPPTVKGADVDYLFAQVSVTEEVVDTRANCGNLLGAVGPYAVEAGLVPPTGDETTLRIHNVNTGMIARSTFATPNGLVDYTSDPLEHDTFGRGAAVRLTFLNGQGAITGTLFPSGAASDEIDGLPVTLIDYSIPVMVLDARDVGLTGREAPAAINANADLLARIERMRLEAGLRMGLGDVSTRVSPKVALIAPPAEDGGTLGVRYLTPWACHTAMAVTGATALAVSAAISGTVTATLLGHPVDADGSVRIEHPSGIIDILLSTDGGRANVPMAGVQRTARRLFEGHVLIPYDTVPDFASVGALATCAVLGRAVPS